MTILLYPSMLKLGGLEEADLLSQLVQSNKFSDDELVEHLLTILVAG